jgi:threonine synthase
VFVAHDEGGSDEGGGSLGLCATNIFKFKLETSPSAAHLLLPMHYISTRDARPPPQRTSYSFIDAVLQGLAPDGGLLVPETFPSVSSEEWLQWKHLEYNDLCFCVLRKFIAVDEVSDAELRTMIAAAYARVHAAFHPAFHGNTTRFRH